MAKRKLTKEEFLDSICKAKKGHRLKVHAEAHALMTMNHPNHRHRARCRLYVYLCDRCGFYHLTRKPQKDFPQQKPLP